MKVLECSSAGDIRFSAFGAKVEAFGVFDTIEQHYQKSKRFLSVWGDLEAPESWKDAKGREHVCAVIGGIQMPADYLTMYYQLLWVKYFDQNPGLLKIASSYDDFHDQFKGKSKVCQADTIRNIVKHGRAYVMKSCEPLLDVLNKKRFVMETEGDLFSYPANILGHQVNAKGVMGAGIAVTVKKLYPSVFQQYEDLCQRSGHTSSELVGMCQLVQVENNRWIANLFGQEEYGKYGCFTEYDALESALKELKKFAQSNQLTVALPKYIGAGKAGGNWRMILDIIEDVFFDYPVTLVEKK